MEHANITEVYSVIRKYCRVSFLWHLQYRSRGVGRIFEMRGQIYNYQRGGGGDAMCIDQLAYTNN